MISNLLKILAEAVRKPGSVPGAGYPFPGGDHSSGTAVTGSLEQPTRRHGRVALNASLFGLAPDGVYLASAVAGGPGELLPHPFTLTCRGRRTSLCGTYPWGRPRWTLSSVTPCGARTFLPSEEERPPVLLQPISRNGLFPAWLRKSSRVIVRRGAATPPHTLSTALPDRKNPRSLSVRHLLTTGPAAASVSEPAGNAGR
jgi:hypothetical protein